MSTPLSESQLAELRDELDAELTRLRRTLVSTEEAAKPVLLDQSALGRLSRVDALQNQHLEKDMLDRHRARESEVLEALRRLDDGTYGICETCGQPIPYGRLLVMPEARSCATCGPRNG